MAGINMLMWWLNPIAYAFGLCVAVWAYRRSRKKGYLILATICVLAMYSLLAAPYINRAVAAHRKPDINSETEKKLNAAIQETTDRVLREAGVQSIAYSHTTTLQLDSILLAAALWLLAKKEKDKPNQASDATSEPAGADSSSHQG